MEPACRKVGVLFVVGTCALALAASQACVVVDAYMGEDVKLRSVVEEGVRSRLWAASPPSVKVVVWVVPC